MGKHNHRDSSRIRVGPSVHLLCTLQDGYIQDGKSSSSEDLQGPFASHPGAAWHVLPAEDCSANSSDAETLVLRQ